MAIAYLLAEYKRLTTARRPTRYCAVDDYTELIRADDGDWREVEIPGNYAIVKVRASVSTLTIIAADPAITYIPLAALTTKLSNLTTAQRNKLLTRLNNIGFTNAQIVANIGTLATATLGQLLKYIARNFNLSEYDAATDTITQTGPAVECIPIDLIDALVQ
ncbi:MAG: hypothetical protein J0I20_35785 [Chloroflexi bacterium]|nr:hypothetical protein [Chloroflexota bacterium]OJV86966.1 MAG: hypothetical protein BGO39_28600 [Chloroflexi bacterium 54-19]